MSPGFHAAQAVQAVAWLADASAAGVAVIRLGLRPGTWRRTVRAEFLRFLDVAGVRSLAAVALTAALVGLSLVAQATYWLDRIGDPDLVRTVIATVLVREIAPLMVGLLVVGRGGLEMLSELFAAGRGGTWRTLRAEGIDPFLFFVVPRTLALAVSVFCLANVFIFVALGTGYLAARVAEVTVQSPGEFVVGVLQSVGATGYLLLPVKAALIGLAIGAVCALTAFDRPGANLIRHGLIRCVIAVLVVSGVVSAIL